MILDRSGSMAGTKMTALKNAATGFLDFFAEPRTRTKSASISFATTAKMDRVLGDQFRHANEMRISTI